MEQAHADFDLTGRGSNYEDPQVVVNY